MKKYLSLLLILFCFSYCFAETPIYKAFTVNEKTENRWVYVSSVEKYDENNNLIYGNYTDHDEWRTYDADGKLIYRKFIYPYRTDESWYDYRGDSMSRVDSRGNKYLHKFDSNGNLIYYESSDGTVNTYTYDSHNNKIYHRFESDGMIDEAWIEYEYDEQGNIVYSRNSGKFILNGKTSEWVYEERNEYDNKGNVIYRILYDVENETSEEYYFKYDSNNNLIYSNEKGYDKYFDYDSENRIIHQIYNTSEYWYEYKIEESITIVTTYSSISN